MLQTVAGGWARRKDESCKVERYAKNNTSGNREGEFIVSFIIIIWGIKPQTPQLTG